MYTKPSSMTSVESADSEYTLSLGELIQVLRRRAALIVLIATMLVGAAVGWSIMQTPVYQASAEILVGLERPDDVPSGLLNNDVQGIERVTQTVVQAVDSRVVADAVIDEMGLSTTSGTLLENLSVEQVPETLFIQISYKDADPERARKIADAFARVSSDRISEVSPGDTAITATVWEPAVKPGVPVTPDPVRNGILALALGIMLGLGLAFLLEYLDDSWRSSEEVELVSGVPTFGVIPEFNASKTSRNGGS